MGKYNKTILAGGICNYTQLGKIINLPFACTQRLSFCYKAYAALQSLCRKNNPYLLALVGAPKTKALCNFFTFSPKKGKKMLSIHHSFF
jgi:hypothetical protein